MDLEKLAKLIEALVAVIQALCWPLIVIFILLYFGTPLKKFLNDIGEFTFKAGAGGLEATARIKQQIEAAALLGAASTKSGGEGAERGKPPNEENAREIANVVSQSLEPRLRRKFSEAAILWVDDNPQNNVYERRALEALGMRITEATSTEAALEKIRLKKYDVIISDMGRAPDKQAGYTLLEEKLKLNDRTPYIIYAGSSLPEHRAEARRRGAIGSTNNPQELFQLVISALENG